MSERGAQGTAAPRGRAGPDPRRPPPPSGNVGYALRGTITKCLMPCGKPTCRCKADPPLLHGPYYLWTRRVAGKTRTVRLTYLTAEQAARVSQASGQRGEPEGHDNEQRVAASGRPCPRRGFMSPTLGREWKRYEPGSGRTPASPFPGPIAGGRPDRRTRVGRPVHAASRCALGRHRPVTQRRGRTPELRSCALRGASTTGAG
jgi:hypothetical protein